MRAIGAVLGREIEPGHARIELFDCVWWIYFRRLAARVTPGTGK